MTVSVTRRIHIAPQGYEDERIHLAATELDADRVILLPHDDNDENELAERCRENIMRHSMRQTSNPRSIIVIYLT